MTDTHTTFFQQAPAPEPTPKRKRKWILPTSLVLGGMLLGYAGGTGNQPEPVVQQVEVPGPERVVEKEVEVVKEVAPASCIEALDLSERGFTYASEAMGYMSEAMTAASQFDVAGIEAASAKLKILNPKIADLTDPMKAAAGTCRAAE